MQTVRFQLAAHTHTHPKPVLKRVFLPGPCTQIVHALALQYLYRDHLKTNVNTVWVHGPLGRLGLSELELEGFSMCTAISAGAIVAARWSWNIG